jgi:hypothetical protein
MPDETVLRAKAREVIRTGKLPSRRPDRPTRRVLPMELQLGDHIMDETGEWEVTGRPFTTAAGKNAHARVRKVRQPEFTDLLSWGAHERFSVKRATAAESKR